MRLRTEAEIEIDADALRDFAEETRRSRRFCAVLWGFVLAFAGVAAMFTDGMEVALSVLGAFITLLLSLSMGKPSMNERLDRPRLYRLVTGAFLAVALFGVALAAVPAANDITKILAVYFGLVALFAYRAVVARGPRAALGAATIAMVAIIPFGFVLLVGSGCRREYHEPPWTVAATGYVLVIMLLLLPVLAIAALVSFRPRHDFMPDAIALPKRRPE
jgi:hypothetical protein